MVQGQKAAIRDEDYAIFIDDRGWDVRPEDRMRLSKEEMESLFDILESERPDLFTPRKRK